MTTAMLFIKKVDQRFASVMFSIKKILERWDQSLDPMENPKQAGKTTAIGTLF